jgi:hypothetical protein
MRGDRPHRRTALAPRRRLALGRRKKHEGGARRKTQQRGQHEGGTPADILHHEAGQDGRKRDAQVAHQAVDADGGARVARMLHQHRNAHRMVDGRKGAQHGDSQRQLPGVLCCRTQQARSTEPEEKHHHHAAPAPQVAQPPGRHRTEAEQQEGAGAIRHQVFPSRKTELDGDAGHRGGEDQQEHVVQCMAQVQQE